MKKILRPILTNAHAYNESEPYRKTPPGKDKRLSYEENKKILIGEITSIENDIKNYPEKFIMDDVIINLRMRIDRSSKSYHPTKLLRDISVKEVGTKKWGKQYVKKKKNKEEVEWKFGKDIFIMINKNNLKSFKESLIKDSLDDSDKDAIRSIDCLYYDKHDNILNSFDDKWESGRIEIVLHPYFQKDKEMLDKFYELLKEAKADLSSIKIKQYNDGPTFISMKANKKIVKSIAPFNPLRSIHPLKFRNLDDVSTSDTNVCNYTIQEGNSKPSVTVGVFDGGIPSNHPILEPYVDEVNLTTLAKSNEDIMHGTAVCSALLFGDLKNIKGNILPIPTVKVESFRVLPLTDPNDIDLYEIIDNIEKMVPTKKDIKVYNISLGPVGPIEDDIISRFTYAIDRLSKDGERIFVVAVGNDGHLDDGLGRIQSPADSVNNIAVGCYDYDNEGKIIRADYSCYGDGREGAKVKPDIVEYGGSSSCNMKFIGLDGMSSLYGIGTSFAAPIVARKLAEILGYSSIKSPLTSKALMIQSSDHPNTKPDKYLGYGVVKNNYLDMLECSKNKITVIYESSLLKGKMAKLAIPLVKNLNFDGRVKISWTICVNTSANNRDADDYTDMSIKDTFYPNVNKFTFTHPNTGKKRSIDILKDSEEAKLLYDTGWEQSGTPKSSSNTTLKYSTEQELRKDFKWDTVTKRTSGKVKFDDLNEPYIVIHALSRDREDIESDTIQYSIALTIEYIKCKEDVYEKTLEEYPLLQQAEIEIANEVRIENR